jgi:hypothetical protein
MTTVAVCFKRKQIAADSQASFDGGHYLVSKIRPGTNSVFAAAGDWAKILKYYSSLEKDGDGPDEEHDLDVIELREDGIWVYSESLYPAKIKNDFFAIGSGAAYAIAAMHCGKTPVEAVEIAALYDPATGGPVDTFNLSDLLKKPKTRKIA